MKLSPANVTQDAALLITTLLEAEPQSFDPEAELTRLATYTCPECGGTVTSSPDEEGLVDCFSCGIWFDPFHEANRQALHQKLPESEPIHPEDPQTPDEIKDYIEKYGAGPPRKEIKHIETKSDYAEYQRRVAKFFEKNNIDDLTTSADADGNIESYFGWSPCDCCRRHLGGERYAAVGHSYIRGIVLDFNICADCMYYAEYGQLDDLTMLNLKDDTK